MSENQPGGSQTTESWAGNRLPVIFLAATAVAFIVAPALFDMGPGGAIFSALGYLAGVLMGVYFYVH